MKGAHNQLTAMGNIHVLISMNTAGHQAYLLLGTKIKRTGDLCLQGSRAWVGKF